MSLTEILDRRYNITATCDCGRVRAFKVVKHKREIHKILKDDGWIIERKGKKKIATCPKCAKLR